jgi:predicted metal-dependent HD superfamily phosphohydrolase
MKSAKDICTIEWQNLAQLFDIDSATSNTVLDYLLLQYALPGRHYHNLDHIAFMLERCNEHEAALTDKPSVKLAILFHDVVCNPLKRDNEETSAMAFNEMLGHLLPKSTIDNTCELIMATKTHTHTGNGDVDMLIDFDLLVLAEPWDAYEQYAKNVMNEYLLVYSKSTYKQGRIGLFLRPAIDRGSVFASNRFAALTPVALKNMSKEVSWLESALP